MRIGDELARFVSGPVTIVLGTVDPTGRPEIGRGLAGVAVAADAVEIVLSRAQWPATADDVTATGRLAGTFTRPADYVSYQLKGTATMRAADVEDLARAEAYIAETRDVFDALGLAPGLADQWLQAEDPVVLRLVVDAVFIQTPGQRAGASLP
jgi:hypothetical protein